MDYLTQHYKNLSEQLQAKVNHLQNLLEAYPGGMTPGRSEILFRSVDPQRPGGIEGAIARGERALTLRMRANDTDRRRAAEDRARDKAKGMKLSIIDRVSGTAYDQSGEGARFIAHGEDGKHYTFNSAAKWAWDNEDPGEAPQTFEVDSSNPDHGIRDLMPVDWNNKHDAKEFRMYHPDFKG